MEISGGACLFGVCKKVRKQRKPILNNYRTVHPRFQTCMYIFLGVQNCYQMKWQLQINGVVSKIN